MQLNLNLRPLIDEDGPAMAGLSFSAPNNGGIGYAANYRVDAVKGAKALYGDMEGVAACAPGSARMVGVGITRYGTCLVEGEPAPFAVIGNLVVHPDFRNLGLVDLLVDWQVRAARERIGAQGIMLANYQRSNLAYDRVFRRYMNDRVGPLEYHPLRGLPDAPQPHTAGADGPISAGPLAENEYETFASRLNEFYADYNFHQPASAQSLEALVRRSPVASPIRHAYTAVDARGNLLAGLIVNEEYRVRELEIRSLPRVMAALNRVIHHVPEDGSVREIILDHLWFRPGQMRAAQHLIDTVRWIWSNRVTTVSSMIDPRGQLKELFPSRPWSVMARVVLTASSPRPIDPNRLVRPIQ